MLSSNNYLGLADHPKLAEAAREGLRRYGCGTASVRFICGTLDIHRELEERIAEFVGADDALLYSSCATANEGLIPALMGEGDLICSDALNHASIIDGIRLSRANRHIYPHRDIKALEEGLERHKDAGLKMVVTDGVFSMEGDLAPLPEMADLADRYGAFLVVDESHALGILGGHGRGTAEHLGVEEQVQIQTGTLGKSLGGAMGGYIAGSRDLIDFLTQSSTALHLLKCSATGRCFRWDGGPRTDPEGSGSQDSTHGKYRILPKGNDPRWLRNHRGVSPDRPRHDRRHSKSAGDERRAFRRGHLRHRLRLPSRSEGGGPPPGANLRRTQPGRSRPLPRSLSKGRKTARHYLETCSERSRS